MAWVDWMVRECLHRMALVIGVAWVNWMGSACIAWHEWWEWHGSTGWGVPASRGMSGGSGMG